MAIASALNRSVDLDQALQATLAQVADLLDLRTGWIWLLDAETGASYLAASQNLPPALAANPRRMEGRCYCLDTYRAGDLDCAANVNVVTCSRLQPLVDGTHGLRYHASIPLYAHEEKLGVLNVASPDWRELSPEDLHLLHAVGDLLSIAIERARLFARAAQLGMVEERNRLAREIHDTLAQELTGLTLRLESAEALYEAGAERAQVRAALQQALALSRASLDETRRSVLDLRATSLEGRTLTQALQALVMASNVGGRPVITFEATGATTIGERPLPARIEDGLYRIAQEALTNISRHAHARHASVRVFMAPEQVRCVIRDDGRGFDPAQVATGRYGLLGMRERAKLLGGQLCLETEPGHGTRIEIIVPLEARR
jgi:two-component system NarL family sensor kinase